MSNARVLGNVWIKHDTPMKPLRGHSDQIERRVWFKSEPLTREFCQRVIQLQICTDSHDQGYASNISQGSWTWFEVVILPNSESEEPKRTKDGREMAWRSHANQTAHGDKTLHYGLMFDRRSELLASLEVDNVLAVRACVRFPGWVNNGERAFITTRMLNDDLLFPSDMWTLTSNTVTEHKHETQVEDCVYTYSAAMSCFVKASDANIQSKIWFSTPVFTKDMIDQLESLQLLTRSRFQRGHGEGICHKSDDESYSWFDIVILKNSKDTTPKVVNGVSMVWLSHKNFCNDFGPDAHPGQLFDESLVAQAPGPNADPLFKDWHARAVEIKSIKSALEEGDSIAVRVSAQFSGWEAYAESGHLVVRISNKKREAPEIEIPDFSDSNEQAARIKEVILKYNAEIVNPEGVLVPVEVPMVTMLDQEIRADQVMPPPSYESVQTQDQTQNMRPLRLLSLDGGGVRGVSELRVLRRVMDGLPKVPLDASKPISASNSRAPHPYEVFDMMAGTSTGGLIALMLGRLKMTIDECDAAYDVVSKAIFGSKEGYFIRTPSAAFMTGEWVYASEPLVDQVKALVKKHLHTTDDNTKLLTNDTDGCKVFVVTCRANSTNDGQQVVLLRSYDTKGDHSQRKIPVEYTLPDIAIWEAARATSAAPAYFQRLTHNGHEFIDGGMVYNNPSILLLAEAGPVFGYRRPIGCLLSLGTGVPVNLEFSKGAAPISNLISMLTNSEKAHFDVSELAPSRTHVEVDKYMRLNLSKALSDAAEGRKPPVPVKKRGFWDWFGKAEKTPKDYEQMIKDMDDWQGIERIRELTDDWLESEGPAIQKCVEYLSR